MNLEKERREMVIHADCGGEIIEVGQFGGYKDRWVSNITVEYYLEQCENCKKVFKRTKWL